MAGAALLACIIAGHAYRTTSVRLDLRSRRVCPQLPAILARVASDSSDPAALADDCRALGGCVKISNKTDQDTAASMGVIEAIIGAQGRFPDDKRLQVSCTRAASAAILFNRENGLRAGLLGGLNLTFAAYRKWIDDPEVNTLGGAIGAYFDYVNENRAMARELGGIQLLIQNIKNNFHGQISDWAYAPVKESLFGLSSGCWRNQDICYGEGFVGLAVGLMREHTAETKIAEETLQAVKALIWYSDTYRREFVHHGGAEALISVLQENQGDRGAVSLACETLRYLVGPIWMPDASGHTREVQYETSIHRKFVEAGAVNALVGTIKGHKDRQHFEHGNFNFDVNETYNADSQCLEAAGAMAAFDSGWPSADAMVKAGLAEDLTQKVRNGELDPMAQKNACKLLKILAANHGGIMKC